MTKNPLFSVIVPAYNEEQSIKNTLRSLKEQTFRDFEIIVVNNNSTDKTAEIAKKEVKKVLLEKKQGYLYAVDRGFREAKGEFVAAADADAIYFPDWLERVNRWIEKNPEIVAVYGTGRFYDHNPLVNYVSSILYSFWLHFSKLVGFENTPGFNFVMRKKAYISAGRYDSKKFNVIGSDAELGIRVSKVGHMVLDTSIVVLISSRRFKKNGLIKTTLLLLNTWLNLFLKKTPKMTYNQYNIVRR
jgi:glycosyltransferase involved in cell wall biosynthesis